MARYTVHVSTPKPADEAFAYMADLRNFAEWDPGVKEVEQIQGDGAGADATFDVTVNSFAQDLILRYRMTIFEPSTKLTARAESKMVTSLDTITVTTTDHGSIVTYDAELTLNGPLKLADPLLGLAFRRIGERAAKGLIAALDGKRVEAGRR